MDLESVIRNALNNPACVLNDDHHFSMTHKHPLQYTCNRCGKVVDVPPDMLFDARQIREQPVLGYKHGSKTE